ncbi:Nucleobindin-2-like [Homarus americanus]|uniref:Nucleobindin-2-like n=1 Tax=Homarus americanus TaxID=6706 RepID=A0A8J5MUB6_HOMAM|nr:Nucleobindin-2-like [Homarus americanus]
MNMRWGVLLALALALVEALPVKEKRPEEHKEEQQHKEGEEQSEDWELNLEYGRYLKEVVQALESDPSFRKKLETAEVDDIKSGKIARELHFVDHNVRTKLDELKRRELERLRHLAVREHEKQTGVDRNLLKVPVHIDHKNPTRFEVEDLKKLIMKTTEDLEKVDEQRRTEFKTYELEKEFERQQELSALDESHRKTAETQHQDEVKKHKQHSKLHHPGSKQQLEEVVWEEQDHMQPEDFDPKTFFHLHDLDGNGFWDEIEVKALFKKELDKMYDPNASEDDINERYEEMERMREHVFKESDIDKDNLISFREFVDQTKRAEFEQDGGWQGLDEQEIYSQHEYEEYERQRQEEIRRLVEAGAGYQAAPQGYQAVPQGYQAVPQGYQAVPQGYQAVPQGYQAIPQGYQQVQFAPQGVPYQVPAQPGQHPQGQVQQGQPSAGQVQQGQPPQGNIQGQPPQGQVVQGQPPQGHLPQGQVAQGQPAQGQVVNVQPAQGQVVQGQFVQGQVPQGQGVQGQPAQGQVLQGQPPQGQVPAVGQVGQNPPPVAGNNVGGQPRAGK